MNELSDYIMDTAGDYIGEEPTAAILARIAELTLGTMDEEDRRHLVEHLYFWVKCFQQPPRSWSSQVLADASLALAVALERDLPTDV